MQIIVGSYDGALMGFEAKPDFTEVNTLYSFSASTASLKTLYMKGKLLFVGGFEEIIKVYDCNRKKEISLLEGHIGTVNILTGHDTYVVSGGEDGFVNLWQTKGNLVHKFNAENAVIDCCIHSSGKVMISATKNNRIQLWNLMNLKRLFIKKFKFTIQKVRFYQEVNNLVIMSESKIYIVDCETNKIAHSINFEHGLTDLILVDTAIIVSDQIGYIYFLHLDLSNVENKHTILFQFRAHQMRTKAMCVYESEGIKPILFTISSNGEIKAWDCLQYADQAYSSIDLKDQLKPIHEIKTGSRLTCITIATELHAQQQQEEQHVVADLVEEQNVTQIKKKKKINKTVQQAADPVVAVKKIKKNK